MRKITLLIVLSLVLTPLTASARSGDIAGEYYSTDIHTLLNGVEIDSINIGGQTLINAEDMKYFSFNIYWSDEDRTLDIYSTPLAANGAPPVIKKSNYPSGMVLGDYYETDIVTSLDGDRITAYNTGGKTYINAEQMADMGYVVVWNETDRVLSITSPDRAGYTYNIFLSHGEKHSEESIGAFSISYDNGNITGSADANYLNSILNCNGKEYTLSTEFYQNDGLFQSTALKNLLYTLACDGNIANPCDPSEKYDLVNENVKISINGYESNKITVIQTRGNGHVDFLFSLNDIPMFKKDEIQSVYFSVGNTDNTEKYTITKPETGPYEIDYFWDKLKKYSSDYIQTYYVADDYIAISVWESQSLGVIKHRLYLANRQTKEISDDILEQVRELDGFNFDILNPFAVSVGDIKNNLFFSCMSEQKTGDFYVEMDSATVHLLAEHDN